MDTLEKQHIEIIPREASDVFSENFIDYAMSVITSRALPDVKDGLKPVHRRILYSMNENGNNNDKPHRKSARAVGDTMGVYHPHGDSSIYEAMVNLAQPFSTRYPLIDMHGNVGSIDGDPAAAMRYCLIGSTLITTEKGLIRIEDIVQDSIQNSEYMINLFIESVDSPNRAIKFFNSGVHPVKRITLSGGYSLAGSYNHPVLTLRNDGKTEWKILETIAKNDLVVISRKTKTICNLFEDKLDLKEEKNMFNLLGEIIIEKKEAKSHIRCKTDSLESARNLQVKLLHYGMMSSIVAEDEAFYIIIANKDNLSIFKDCIGFSDPAKRVLLEEIIPKTRNAFLPKNRTKSEFLNKNNLVAVPVNAIEELEPECVYSIKVHSDCHSFVSNGIISHNTESRLSQIADEAMKDIEKDTVDMKNNFDDTTQEPVVLPGLIPIMLANGSEGIAVGMATKMAPHNLTELFDAAVYMLDKVIVSEEPDVQEIYKIIKGPDFPLGGTIIGKAGILESHITGKGRIILRADYVIEREDSYSTIVFTTIPYQVNKTILASKIDSLRKNGTMQDIKEVRDESNKEGIRFCIELKKDANVKLVLNKLFKNTSLQIGFSINNTLLINGVPCTIGIEEIMNNYLSHCVDVIRRRSTYDLNKYAARLSIVNGILWAIKPDTLDKVIHSIRSSKNTEEAVRSIIAIDGEVVEEQAKSISEMKLRQLTSESEDKYLAEQKDLQEKITKLESILQDNVILFTTLKEELLVLKEKFGDKRRTKIVEKEDDIEEIDCIEEETFVITFSTNGIIKSVEEKEYKTTSRGTKGVKSSEIKEDEIIKYMLTVKSREDLLFFTNLGRCHVLKAYKVQKASRTSRGKSINNYLNLEEGEIVVSLITTDLNDKDNSFLFVTKNGLAKRLAFSNLSTSRSITKVISFRDDDMLIAAVTLKDDEEVILTSACGLSIRFEGLQIRGSGRSASGVKAISLREYDYLVDAVKVKEEQKLLTLTKFGFGKNTDVSEYRTQSRGGKGITTHKLSESTGELVCANIISDEDELFVATAKGKIVRIDAKNISSNGRSTKGSKVVSLSEDDYIIAISSMEKEIATSEEEAEGEECSQTTPLK